MSPRTVLIASTDPDLAAVLGDRFAAGGLDVRTADGPQAGLSSAASAPPDLALLDFVGMSPDDLEVLCELKSRSPQVPVIVISSNDMGGREEACLQNGADGFFLKPFESDVLMRTVNGILGV